MKNQPFVRVGSHTINTQAIAFIEHDSDGIVIFFIGSATTERATLSLNNDFAPELLKRLESADD